MNRIKFTEEQMLVVESVSRDNYDKGIVYGIAIGIAVSVGAAISFIIAQHYEIFLP